MKQITVIGAGTMGHGIAHVSAMAGYNVMLTDQNRDILSSAIDRIKSNLDDGVERGKISQDDARSALGRITCTSDLSQAVQKAGLVIEAVIEDLGVKQELFRTAERHVSVDTVLATNTSSLPIGEIAACTTRPAQVIGMHFFNPVHIMKLIELIAHDGTSSDTLAQVEEVAIKMGKTAIKVKDTPGFATSRLGVVLGLEAMRMVEQAVASADDIDKAMELGYGHPMGPLKVSDLVGLDIRLAIAKHLHGKLKDDQYKPPRILTDMVKKGDLGRKSGKGFYEWESTKTSC
ncbi:MAG: 3-hydroxyacyl-CoA dehydrogenase family protein [Gemmatimonadales bacterium]